MFCSKNELCRLHLTVVFFVVPAQLLNMNLHVHKAVARTRACGLIARHGFLHLTSDIELLV